MLRNPQKLNSKSLSQERKLATIKSPLSKFCTAFPVYAVYTLFSLRASSPVASPLTSFGVRSSRIHFPPTSAGRLSLQGTKRKESLQIRVWNLNSTSNFSLPPCQLSYQISANQRVAETRANVNKHLKTRAKGNDVISANQHFASTFPKQILKSGPTQIPETQLQALLPSPPPPLAPGAARAPRTACSHVI